MSTIDMSSLEKRSMLFASLNQLSYFPREHAELNDARRKAAQLDLVELHECHRIVNLACQALHPENNANPRIMDYFLSAVFKDWSRGDEVRKLKPFNRTPLQDIKFARKASKDPLLPLRSSRPFSIKVLCFLTFFFCYLELI